MQTCHTEMGGTLRTNAGIILLVFTRKHAAHLIVVFKHSCRVSMHRKYTCQSWCPCLTSVTLAVLLVLILIPPPIQHQLGHVINLALLLSHLSGCFQSQHIMLLLRQQMLCMPVEWQCRIVKIGTENYMACHSLCSEQPVNDCPTHCMQLTFRWARSRSSFSCVSCS